MALFPDTMPRPEPNMDDAAFWENCAARRLAFQACAACGAFRHPPSPLCPRCHSAETTWANAPETAEVYSFTVVHYPSHPAVREHLSYVVAVLRFDGIDGVKFVSNVTGVAPGHVRIGMRVELWWDDIGEGMHLPRFRPAT